MWIGKSVSIWCDHHLPHVVHLVHRELIMLIVECCPTLQWLCEVAGYQRELEHAIVHVDPEHPKHAQRVTCLVSMQAMASFQELCTDP